MPKTGKAQPDSPRSTAVRPPREWGIGLSAPVDASLDAFIPFGVSTGVARLNHAAERLVGLSRGRPWSGDLYLIIKAFRGSGLGIAAGGVTGHEKAEDELGRSRSEGKP